MSKYIDADKLIALIDAKFEDLGLSGSVWVGRSVLQELKNDIITSLQQEQPEAAMNLWSEVENFCLEYDARKDAWYNMVPQDQKLVTNPTWLNFALNIARHFYELGLNARKEE